MKRLVPVLLLVVSLGMPWALLQSVAWVGMMAKFSQNVSIKAAVAMTFDGKHPCKLCRLVQRGQAEERDQQKKRDTSDKQLQLGLPPELLVFCHPPVPEIPMEGSISPSGRSERPPSPPPRA